MNKQELIDAIATQTGFSKTQIGKILDSLFETIKKAVAEGDFVQVIGFGRFSSSQRAARTGRNPKTGAPLKILATRIVKFISGKAFKDEMNRKK